MIGRERGTEMSEVAQLIEQSRARDEERQRLVAEHEHQDLLRMSHAAMHFMDEKGADGSASFEADDNSDTTDEFHEGYEPHTPTADLGGGLGKQYDRQVAATGSLSPVEFDIDNLKLRLAEAQQFSTTAESEVDRLRSKLADYEGDAHKSEDLIRELEALRQQLLDAEKSHVVAQKAVESKQVKCR